MSIDTSLDAILAAMTEAFQQGPFKHLSVEWFQEEAEIKQAPMLMLELCELSYQAFNQIEAQAQLQIHCILSAAPGQARAALSCELWAFADCVSQFVLEQGVWLKDCGLSEPQNLEVYPGKLRTEFKGGYLDSLVISFQQRWPLSPSIWRLNNTTRVSELLYARTQPSENLRPEDYERAL